MDEALTNKAILELKMLYEEKLNITLSDEEVYEQGMNFLALLEIMLRETNEHVTIIKN